MKKILVTGATGFIGTYVTEELVNKGYGVIATSAHEDKAVLKSWYKKVLFVEFDFNTFNPATDYYKFFGEPDILIHLAWQGLPNYKESFHITENLPSHFNFLKNMVKGGLKDLTVTGTCFEYGMKQGCLSEDIEVEPANAYAIAKNELRKQLEDLSKVEALNLKWVRLFYMYGRGQNERSLVSQLDKALENNDAIFHMSGGEQLRDFLPAEKVAEYIVAIATQEKITGLINCCSGKPLAVKDFVKKYAEEKNKSISLDLGYYPYADYEAMEFWGDDTKLKNILSND